MPRSCGRRGSGGEPSALKGVYKVYIISVSIYISARTDQPEDDADHDANAAGERDEVVDVSFELRPSPGAPILAVEHPAHRVRGVGIRFGAWLWAKGGRGRTSSRRPSRQR